MTDIARRLDELEKYQHKIVASIKELNGHNNDQKQKIALLEKENEELRQLVNANGTNIMIEQAKRDTDIKKIIETIDKLDVNKQTPICVMEKSERIDIPLPTFFGNQRDPHPKKFLGEIEKYFALRKIGGDDH